MGDVPAQPSRKCDRLETHQDSDLFRLISSQSFQAHVLLHPSTAIEMGFVVLIFGDMEVVEARDREV